SRERTRVQNATVRLVPSPTHGEGRARQPSLRKDASREGAHVYEELTRSALIREARREIRAKRCPRHIRKDAWGHVIDLLVCIAGYLPDCWPSERTLAAKLGKHPPNVHRTIVRARAEGLLVTTPRPLEHSWRMGQAYHLVCLSKDLQAAIV